MKNCEEMVQSLLKRREQYVAAQKRKKTIVVRTAVTVCSVCLVALVGFGLQNSGWIGAVPSGNPQSGNGEYTAGGTDTTSSGIFCGDYWVPENSGSSAEETGAASSDATSSGIASTTEDVCHHVRQVFVDGAVYVEYENAPQTYTPAECIGSADQFEGTYRTFFADCVGKVYTTQEDADVLLVKEMGGRIVSLIRIKE